MSIYRFLSHVWVLNITLGLRNCDVHFFVFSGVLSYQTIDQFKSENHWENNRSNTVRRVVGLGEKGTHEDPTKIS